MPPSFFNDPAPAEIYPLPLHAALPISNVVTFRPIMTSKVRVVMTHRPGGSSGLRSEEHTSELQSPLHLPCPLLFLTIRRPPRSTLFPSTPLFRSPTSSPSGRS